MMKKKWIWICGICALPSFTLALSIGFGALFQIFGMLLGVVTFIVIFSLFEESRLNSRLFGNPTCLRAKRFAIGAKVATAIIAFVGCVGIALHVEALIFLAFLEAYPGSFSVYMVESLWWFLGWQAPIFGSDLHLPFEIGSWNWSHMGFTFLTTLVQGTLLSLIMIAFGVLAMPACMALGKWSKTPASEAPPQTKQDML